MGWKDWSSWLKGGTVSLAILLMIYLYIIVTQSFSLLDYILIKPARVLDFNHYISNFLPYLYIFGWIPLLILLIIYFIIGAIIGWIVGRIKNKN